MVGSKFVRSVLPKSAWLALSGLLLVLMGCKGGGTMSLEKKSSTDTSTAPKTLNVGFTDPIINKTVTNATYNFQWATSGTATLRSYNTFRVRTYSQAACMGTPVQTYYVATPQSTMTGIRDTGVYSMDVSAFDSQDNQSVETCSSALTGKALISILQVRPGAAYLSIEADTTNKMAYLGAAYGSSVFFDAVDYNDEANPVWFRTVGSGTTPSSNATQSRGVAVYNGGQRLLVASNGSGLLELWDLTANPRTGTWTKLASLGGLGGLRKIAKVDTSNPTQTVVYLALRSGAAIVNIAEPAGTMTIDRINGGYSNCLGNGAVIGAWMISGCYFGGWGAFLIRLSDLSNVGSYAFPDAGSGTNLWASATSPDGTRAYVGGANGGFFTYDPSTPAVAPVVSYRFNAPGTWNRDAQYVVESSVLKLYAGDGSGQVIQWDVSNPAAPVATGVQPTTDFGVTSEGYGIRVDPVTHRAYFATLDGKFVILNTEMFRAPTVPFYQY